MKALTWMRKLAATTALLALTLALVAPIAEANVPRRPIDRPEGPPEPNPTEVGDPDTGNNVPRELLIRLWIGVLGDRFPEFRGVLYRVAFPARESRMTSNYRLARRGR